MVFYLELVPLAFWRGLKVVFLRLKVIKIASYGENGASRLSKSPNLKIVIKSMSDLEK